MKKLGLVMILVASLAGCATSSGTAGNTANTGKSNSQDMTYRGGSL